LQNKASCGPRLAAGSGQCGNLGITAANLGALALIADTLSALRQPGTAASSRKIRSMVRANCIGCAMRLYRVILPVANIEEASNFYSSVLGQPGKRVSGGRHYFGDASNGCVLAVYSPADDGDARRYGRNW
jgi:hypothetical protein